MKLYQQTPDYMPYHPSHKMLFNCRDKEELRYHRDHQTHICLWNRSVDKSATHANCQSWSCDRMIARCCIVSALRHEHNFRRMFDLAVSCIYHLCHILWGQGRATRNINESLICPYNRLIKCVIHILAMIEIHMNIHLHNVIPLGMQNYFHVRNESILAGGMCRFLLMKFTLWYVVFVNVQPIIYLYPFRHMLGTEKATGHYLNRSWFRSLTPVCLTRVNKLMFMQLALINAISQKFICIVNFNNQTFSLCIGVPKLIVLYHRD